MKLLLSYPDPNYCYLAQAYFERKEAKHNIQLSATAVSIAQLKQRIKVDKPDVLVLNNKNTLSVLTWLANRGSAVPPRVIVLSDGLSEELRQTVTDFRAVLFDQMPDLDKLLDLAQSISGQLPEQPLSKKARYIEKTITFALHELGIPPHLQGFRFLRQAVMLTLADSHSMDNMTKKLYPALAKLYETTPLRVERSIRTAIQAGFQLGSREQFNALFSGTKQSCEKCPTASSFITILTDSVRNTMYDAVD